MTRRQADNPRTTSVTGLIQRCGYRDIAQVQTFGTVTRVQITGTSNISYAMILLPYLRGLKDVSHVERHGATLRVHWKVDG